MRYYKTNPLSDFTAKGLKGEVLVSRREFQIFRTYGIQGHNFQVYRCINSLHLLYSSIIAFNKEIYKTCTFKTSDQHLYFVVMSTTKMIF